MTALINEYSLKYHRKRLKNFWKKWNQGGKHYATIRWWMECMALEPMKAGKEAKSLIKDMIRMATLEKKISIEEATRLWDMVKSEDKENQYIALSIIQGIYPNAFLKQEPKFTLL